MDLQQIARLQPLQRLARLQDWQRTVQPHQIEYDRRHAGQNGGVEADRQMARRG